MAIDRASATAVERWHCEMVLEEQVVYTMVGVIDRAVWVLYRAGQWRHEGNAAGNQCNARYKHEANAGNAHSSCKTDPLRGTSAPEGKVLLIARSPVRKANDCRLGAGN